MNTFDAEETDWILSIYRDDLFMKSVILLNKSKDVFISVVFSHCKDVDVRTTSDNVMVSFL